MKQPFFLLLISGTDLIKYPGISAAGASHEMLRYTAKLDAEFLMAERRSTCHREPVVAQQDGRGDPSMRRTGSRRRPFGTPRDDNPEPRTLSPEHFLPVSPHGIVSPALITKACLNLLAAKVLILDLGTHEKANCDYISINEKPSADITEHNAFDLETAQRLYLQGQDFLSKEIYNHGFDPIKHDLIIAECLVGGTSTALGLLTGLGYDCIDLVSSSYPNGNYSLKKEIINKASARVLQEQKDFRDQVKQEPLIASAALGDALQPFICGMALAAIKNNVNIILAGGSQMLAIKTLIDHKLAIDHVSLKQKLNQLLKIITTPWILNDPSANFQKLKTIVSDDTIIEIPDIDQVLANQALEQEVQRLSEEFLSQKLTLQSIINTYNQGHVKEGVGLGAALWQLTKKSIR